MTHEQLCMGCMQAKAPESDEEPCSECGFVLAAEQRSARHLPARTVLRDKYLLGRVLGAGGFGVTYLAFDLQLETPVAVKEYLPRDCAARVHGTERVEPDHGQEELFKRGLSQFLTEAKVLAKFDDHVGIVSVREYFNEHNTAYFVMPYLDGCTLRDYLTQRGGQLGLREALQIIRPVTQALTEVHRLGLLHRDVSPDNVMLTKSKRVKLLDFGAAREASSDTRTRSVVLKPGYAPVEQYRAKSPHGPALDVYGAAATLYRMLTGQVPPDALDRMAGEALISPAQCGVELPAHVEAAVLDGLALTADERISSIEAFAERLFDSEGRESSSSRRNSSDPQQTASEPMPRVANPGPLRSPSSKPDSVWTGSGIASARAGTHETTQPSRGGALSESLTELETMRDFEGPETVRGEPTKARVETAPESSRKPWFVGGLATMVVIGGVVGSVWFKAEPKVSAVRQGQPCLELDAAQSIEFARALENGGPDRPKDLGLAVGCYERAALLNHPGAGEALVAVLKNARTDLSADQREIGVSGRAALERVCKVNPSASCRELGWMYRLGQGGSVDLVSARTFFAKACGVQEQAACVDLAEVKLLRGATKEDQAAGVVRLKSACAAKYGRACGYLAGIQASGQFGQVQSAIAAFATAEEACELNDANGCLWAASCLRRGECGVSASGHEAKDMSDKALQLAQRDCDSDDGRACSLWSWLLCQPGADLECQAPALQLAARGLALHSSPWTRAVAEYVGCRASGQRECGDPGSWSPNFFGRFGSQASPSKPGVSKPKPSQPDQPEPDTKGQGDRPIADLTPDETKVPPELSEKQGSRKSGDTKKGSRVGDGSTKTKASDVKDNSNGPSSDPPKFLEPPPNRCSVVGSAYVGMWESVATRIPRRRSFGYHVRYETRGCAAGTKAHEVLEISQGGNVLRRFPSAQRSLVNGKHETKPRPPYSGFRAGHYDVKLYIYLNGRLVDTRKHKVHKRR